MSFNDKSGFSLLEVIIAMATVAGIVTMLLMLQSALLQQTRIMSERVERMLLLPPFLQEAREKTADKKREALYEKEVQEIPTKLTYRRIPPPHNSALHTSKHIYLEQVSASWKSGRDIITQYLVTTTYIPQKHHKETR